MKLNRPDLMRRIEEKTTPEPMSGCLLWTGSLDSTEYASLTVDGKTRTVHRIVWELTRGRIPKRLHVLHTCDVRSCLNERHMFLGTHKDNMRDMREKGRNNHRLSVEDVRLIRVLRTHGWSQTALCEEFGVAQSAISKIDRGLRWGWVAP